MKYLLILALGLILAGCDESGPFKSDVADYASRHYKQCLQGDSFYVSSCGQNGVAYARRCAIRPGCDMNDPRGGYMTTKPLTVIAP